MSRSLALPFNPRPPPNALEFFKDNRPLRAFGFGNDPLADVMIRVFLKAALTPRKSFQMAFGRLRSDLLKRLTAACIPLAAMLDMLARKCFSIAVSREIDDAEINPKEAFSINRFRRLDFASNEQIPLATNQSKIGFAALCSKQLALALATDERNRLPPVQSPNRGFRTFDIVGQNAIIVGDSTMGLKRAPCLAIQLVGICDLADTAYRKLRGQVELLG